MLNIRPFTVIRQDFQCWGFLLIINNFTYFARQPVKGTIGLFSSSLMGVLAELCQQGLFEAMGFNALLKNNTELINYFFPIIGRRLPFDV